MNTIKILISTAALCVASAAFAQSSNTCSWLPKGDEYGQGTIGKRYAEAGLFTQSIRHTSHSVIGAGVSANLPIINHIDISGGYDYRMQNIPDFAHIHAHRASGNVTLFNTIEDGVKPFVSVGLERTWLDSSGTAGNVFANTRNAWNVAAGAEFPYKWFSVTPQVAYQDDFKTTSQSAQAWSVGVEVSAWVTSKIGAYINTTFNNVLHTADDNWVTGAGVRYRF
jgi:hypothetical protein